MKKILTTRLAMVILTLIAMLCIGCGEEVEEEIHDNTATDILGAVKMPEAVAMAPQAPGVPFVKEIGYYRDWKLTKPWSGAVPVGKTIFIKVVFSEDMTVVAADDKSARPILFYQRENELTRFHMVGRGTKLDDGDAKQRGKDAATFTCKYTIQPEDQGAFTLAAGKRSTDTDGVGMAAFYRHEEKLQLGDITPPTVVSATYWRDADCTDPIESIVHPGEDIYTKIVFSEAMRVVKDGQQSLPILSYNILGRERGQYRIVNTAPQHGDAMTHDDTAFICRNTIPTDATGDFWVTVDKKSEDRNTNTMTDFYVSKKVRIEPERAEIRVEPISIAHSDPAALEAQRKAQAIVSRVIDLQSRHFEDPNADLRRAYDILEEETGLSDQFIFGTLIAIYFEEFPEERGKIISWYGAVLEYLRLSFTYPSASEEELLKHYRQSVKDGRVTIGTPLFLQKKQDEVKRHVEASTTLNVIRQSIYDRELAALERWLEDPSFDINAERDKIFKEEAGLSFDFAHNILLRIHLEANPDDQKIIDSGRYGYRDLIFTYLIQRRVHAGESEEQILERFRQIKSKTGAYLKLP